MLRSGRLLLSKCHLKSVNPIVTRCKSHYPIDETLFGLNDDQIKVIVTKHFYYLFIYLLSIFHTDNVKLTYLFTAARDCVQFCAKRIGSARTNHRQSERVQVSVDR